MNKIEENITNLKRNKNYCLKNKIKDRREILEVFKDGRETRIRMRENELQRKKVLRINMKENRTRKIRMVKGIYTVRIWDRRKLYQDITVLSFKGTFL